MSFAEIKKLKELLKTLQESGERSTRTRMEVGKAMEAIRKERAAARAAADVNIEQPLKLFESSYEKSAILGEKWKPPWDMTWEPPPAGAERIEPKISSPRAFDINLNRGALHALSQVESPGGKYSGLSIRTKNILVNKLTYRMRLEESYVNSIRRGDAAGAAAVMKKIDNLDESIYRMGATQWDESKGIPEDWKDTLSAYTKRERIDELSGPFFTGDYMPDTLGYNLLFYQDPKKILNKATIFTQRQWREKEAAQQELQFINNYLLNPEMAAEYAKTAPLSFFKYWSEKGGTLGLKEHMQSLKAAARAEDVEFETAKWGALTTVKDLKSKNFAFASLRGQVTELWEPTSPKISQVGLFQDASGEKIKFTVWKNQQQNIPKVEAGKNYYFGNVASQEWRGRWNLNVNRFSVIEEIKPMPFNTAPPLIVPGRSVELRDYSKPYSIDPIKGTITYTTKSGKVVEMPIQEVDMTPLKKTRLGDERGDLAAFLPFAGIPFVLGNVTGGTAQADSQRAIRGNAGEQVIQMLGGAYDDISILGSIWYQKASEANERIKARDAAAPGAEFGNVSLARANAKYQMAQLPWNVLDVLGGVLYPLSYPGQALWGELSGIGAMEGIRNETSASEVLDIENPLAAFAADITLDPLNLIGIGAAAKGSKTLRTMKLWGTEGFGGVRALLEDLPIGLQVKFENGALSDIKETSILHSSRKVYRDAYKALSEKISDRYKQLESIPPEDATGFERLYKEILADEIQADYLSSQLSLKEQTSATWKRLSDRAALSPQTQRRIDLIEYPEFKEYQDYLKDLQPSPLLPIHAPALISPLRQSKVLGMEIPVTPVDAGAEEIALAIADNRVAKGKTVTEEDVKRIEAALARSRRDTQKLADEKKFPWGTLALGTGIGVTATASLLSVPPEEQDAGREQIREALEPSEEPGILGTFVDVVSMDSYLEGAAIMNARALLTGDTRRYGWEDRITPSIALGIQDKDTDFFSLQGLAGTALDIAVAPTTYLSFGSGAAVKIGSVGGKGAKGLKLSNKGVKELKSFTEKYGKEMGTLEFAHHIEENPAFQKKVLAAGGVNLRGWGQEVNLIPGSTFDPITNAAREGVMRFSLEYPTAFKKVVGVQEYLEDKFVVRAAIKRLPRSSRLLPMEADYAEKAMLLPKKVRFDIAQGTERDIELAKEARKAFGENYEEIVSNLIETPVARESAKLTQEQKAIVEELEAYNKGFAAAEKKLGLLDTEMSGYLRHTLTPEAKKYLEKGGKKVSTEVYTPLSVENKFGAKRTIQGTVSEINERARKELGIDFDYFEANPFKATSIRRAESVKAVEQAKFLKWTVEKYGVSEEVTRAAPDKYVQSSSRYIEGAWLPKPIAEDIEKEFVQKDIGAALQLYDKALSTWKYGATVTHPAYHATNVIGGMFNNWLAEIDPAILLPQLQDFAGRG